MLKSNRISAVGSVKDGEKSNLSGKLEGQAILLRNPFTFILTLMSIVHGCLTKMKMMEHFTFGKWFLLEDAITFIPLEAKMATLKLLETNFL